MSDDKAWIVLFGVVIVAGMLTLRSCDQVKEENAAKMTPSQLCVHKSHSAIERVECVKAATK